MKASNKAKWIVGITGAAFSAFVLGQLDHTPTKIENTGAIVTEINDSMSEREKELVQLDWSNFAINQGGGMIDRTTRRS